MGHIGDRKIGLSLKRAKWGDAEVEGGGKGKEEAAPLAWLSGTATF